jgi:hypothetical protein
MHMAVGGEDGAVAHLKRGAVEARYLAAGFFNHQPACGVIPRVQFLLPESIEPSHGGVTQIHRRRPRTTYRLALRNKILKVIEVVVRRFVDVVGESRCQQAFL